MDRRTIIRGILFLFIGIVIGIGIGQCILKVM